MQSKAQPLFLITEMAKLGFSYNPSLQIFIPPTNPHYQNQQTVSESALVNMRHLTGFSIPLCVEVITQI